MPEPMTLGALRDALAAFKRDARVRFAAFCLVPTRLDSWRGIYAEPALGWKDGDVNPAPTVGALLDDIDRALAGREFTGWKGGEYSYHRGSPVWIANSGDSGQTALVAVDQPYGGAVWLHVAECNYSDWCDAGEPTA